MVNDAKNILKKQLELVQERINNAAVSVGRDPSTVNLTVVTKGKSAAIVKNLFELGVKTIGESYLKEALFKMDLLKDYNIDWHMIGTIQRSKVKSVLDHFTQIQSVDRFELAEEIARRADILKKTMPVYLELNLSGENTKHGWNVVSEKDLDLFFDDAGRMIEFGSIDVRGLMTMAPYTRDPEKSRPYFKQLREIKNKLEERQPNISGLGLSMGMSSDFEVAVEEGSTMLRIGSVIVGQR